MAEKAKRLTLRQMRLLRAMSATELANKAGVSTSTITAIEDIEDSAKPRMATIRKLSAALGCEPQDIAWPGNPFGLLEGGAE